MRVSCSWRSKPARRTERPRWAEIAYEAIAPFYDDFTAHHDYELWLGNLLPKLERHGLRGERLLDVACGTGKSFIPMLERGWEVTACDISASMVELARAKVGDAAELSVADMRDLPELRRVRPRLVPRRRGQLPAQRRGAGAGAARDAAQPRPRRAADVRRQHAAAPTAPSSPKRWWSSAAAGGWSGRAARPPTRCPARSPKPASRCCRSRAGTGRRSRRRCTASATSPKPRCWPRWRRAGLECLDVFGHGEDAVLEQPLRGRGPHTRPSTSPARPVRRAAGAG